MQWAEAWAYPQKQPEWWIAVVNRLAGFYCDNRQFGQAKQKLSENISLAGQALPANHPELAKLYNNMAGAAHGLGVYSQSLEYHKKALAIREEIYEANHPDVAISYNNIAGAYYAMGDYQQAKIYIDKAMQVQEEILPEGHPHRKASEEGQRLIYHALNKREAGSRE